MLTVSRLACQALVIWCNYLITKHTSVVRSNIFESIYFKFFSATVVLSDNKSTKQFEQCVVKTVINLALCLMYPLLELTL